MDTSLEQGGPNLKGVYEVLRGLTQILAGEYQATLLSCGGFMAPEEEEILAWCLWTCKPRSNMSQAWCWFWTVKVWP